MTNVQRHPCRACGNWECGRCRWRRYRASRLAPEKQVCARCGSTEGEFIGIRHSSRQLRTEHDTDAVTYLGEGF